LNAIWSINLYLLIFNMLPIYPLDGGQILRALLWFVLGRARSLLVAAVLGLVGVFGLLAITVFAGEGVDRIWLFLITAFIGLNCVQAFRYARVLAKTSKMPRRAGYACPSCREAPIIGRFWTCPNCRNRFDTFDSHAHCPFCGVSFPVTMCLECGEASPFPEWVVEGALPPVVNVR